MDFNMDQTAKALALAYFPTIMFDEHEPFFPVAIGVSIIRRNAPSPSFQRVLQCNDTQLDCIIEYAIYWDYDIGHLYDLEHVWVYIAKDGSVINCEASFHGKYLKVLLPDRSNLHGKRVELYSQPGKHAFSPIKLLFQLIPNYQVCTFEEAGLDGLIVTAPFRGEYESSPQINELVKEYLQQFRFHPSERYQPYQPSEDIFMSWEQLHQLVPIRIAQQIQMIEQCSH